MKKQIIPILVLSILSFSGFAQNVSQETFKIMVKFESFCCGVPNDKPLNDAIRAFKKKNAIKKIQATRIGPMGREGEYHLGFTLQEMKKDEQTKFIVLLQQVTLKMKDKGQATCELDVLQDKDISSKQTLVQY